MSKRFGKKRVSGCTCTTSFTCRECLRDAPLLDGIPAAPLPPLRAPKPAGPKFYDAEQCRRKADQHWDMAGLARQDGDHDDSNRHTSIARLWEERRAAGGYEEGTT